MRSVVVVLPASTWAMMPMLRSLSSMVAGRGGAGDAFRPTPQSKENNPTQAGKRFPPRGDPNTGTPLWTNEVSQGSESVPAFRPQTEERGGYYPGGKRSCLSLHPGRSSPKVMQSIVL